jgi:LacI family gluconate utilization system Gnt-I transcriptional repressor
MPKWAPRSPISSPTATTRKSAGDQRALQRRQGFADRLARRGLRLVAEQILAAPGSISDGRAGLRAMLPGLGARTALFCGSDLVAFGALTEARALGIAVPERLAICGFGDFELSRASEPPITSVSVDGTAMGRLAAENLLARLAGNAAPSRVLVPFRILPRATTGHPWTPGAAPGEVPADCLRSVSFFAGINQSETSPE